MDGGRKKGVRELESLGGSSSKHKVCIIHSRIRYKAMPARARRRYVAFLCENPKRNVIPALPARTPNTKDSKKARQAAKVTLTMVCPWTAMRMVDGGCYSVQWTCKAFKCHWEKCHWGFGIAWILDGVAHDDEARLGLALLLQCRMLFFFFRYVHDEL